MRQYVGLIHKDAHSDYGVSFPDVPGCITAGRDLDDARAMAEEVLALHVERLIADGEALPEASSLETVMNDAENRDGVAILVKVASPMAKAVRVNITLPEDVMFLPRSTPMPKNMGLRVQGSSPRRPKIR
jgi:predicted RNase H-like HicB family nuclease